MLRTEPQPDQLPQLWDDHVLVYEEAFEPFTLQLANKAIAALGLAAGERVLDVGAGTGGAALAMARQGLRVTAVDGSPRMVERILARAAEDGLAIDAHAMDGHALDLPDAAFAAALSVLGVILFPDAVQGLAEMRRVVRPGGRIAVVTWTQPERYELAAELRAAIQSVCPDQPPTPLPAQLRYREESEFRDLFRGAGLSEPTISTVTACLKAPSARWLAERVGFAPGMAAMMARLGDHRRAVLRRLVENLERRFDGGPVGLRGVAFLATAQVL